MKAGKKKSVHNETQLFQKFMFVQFGVTLVLSTARLTTGGFSCGFTRMTGRGSDRKPVHFKIT